MKKRIISLFLVVLMLFCTGCGKDADTPKPGAQTSGGSESAAPEFVYQPSYFPIDTNTHNIEYINSGCLSGDRAFFAASVVVGKDVYRDEVTGEPYLDENGQTMEMSVTENRLFSLDLQTQALTAFEMDTFTPAEGTFGDSYLGSVAADGQGGVWIMEQTFSYHFDLPENFDAANDDYYQYYVDDGTRTICHHFNAQGVQDKSVELQAPEDSYLNEAYFLPDGSIFSTDWNNIYRFDQTGAVQAQVAVDTGINSILTYSDTQLAVTTWDEGNMVLRPLDGASMTLQDAITMPPNVYRMFPGFGPYSFLYMNGDTLCGYKAGQETGEELLSWLDCDVDSSNLNSYFFDEEGVCYALEGIWNPETERNTYQLIRLDRVDASTVPQKTVLRLACMGLDWNVRTRILEFNRASSDVRITVDDYTQYATEDDYYAGLTKLNTEILSGNVPDLFIMNDMMPTEAYAAKGILQDLWPLIDSDPELSRDDLMTHFFDVLSMDGKLYQVVSNFSIDTVVGRSDVIGTAQGWTLDELMAVRQDYPEATIFGETDTRDGFLYNAVLRNVSQFVDWNSKQCSFDTGTFADLLELAKEFPLEFDYENYDWANAGSEGLRMRQRRQLLSVAFVSGFDQVQYYNAMCEGNANFIGYPSADGSGSTFSVYGGVAISADCENTAAAWQFARNWLLEENQVEEYMYQFPTNRHAFEAYKQQAMTPRWFMTDPETGEEVEQPSNMYYFEDGDEVDIYTMTEEEYQLAIALYEKTDSVSGVNEEINKIINEECEAFFAGEKSADDTAKMIQDRVSLYVLEQS